MTKLEMNQLAKIVRLLTVMLYLLTVVAFINIGLPIGISIWLSVIVTISLVNWLDPKVKVTSTP